MFLYYDNLAEEKLLSRMQVILVGTPDIKLIGAHTIMLSCSSFEEALAIIREYGHMEEERAQPVPNEFSISIRSGEFYVGVAKVIAKIEIFIQERHIILTVRKACHATGLLATALALIRIRNSSHTNGLPTI